MSKFTQRECKKWREEKGEEAEEQGGGERDKEDGSSGWEELGIKLHRMSLHALKYPGRKYIWATF